MNLDRGDGIFLTVLKRDLLLAMRRRTEIVNVFVFYLILVSLFPLAVGPQQHVLQQLAPGILWVCALLSSTLSLDRVFREDYEDGSLEQFLLSTHSLTLIVLAKMLAHWLLSGLPLVILALFMGEFLYLEGAAMVPLFITLLLGTPVFSVLGGIMGALTVGLRNGGILVLLLILPLYVPILIFSVAAVENASHGLAITAELYFLSAMLLLFLTLAPLTAAAALRIRLG